MDALEARGDGAESGQVLWEYDVLAPYCPSPLLLGNNLFVLRANTGIFAVLDAKTGEPTIGPARLPALNGEIYASTARTIGSARGPSFSREI